jgi:hypothetical protein
MRLEEVELVSNLPVTKVSAFNSAQIGVEDWYITAARICQLAGNVAQMGGKVEAKGEGRGNKWG